MAGHEYDVDMLDPNAVAGHFDRMGRRLLEDAGPRGRQDADPFLQRELGRRRADLDRRIRGAISEVPRLQSASCTCPCWRA